MSDNLNKAKDICLQLIDELKKIGIKPKAIHLGEKVDMYIGFEDVEVGYNKAIVIIPQKHYFGDHHSFYTIASNLRTKHETKTFDIGFMFMPYNKGLNTTLIISDGYHHKYSAGKWENENDKFMAKFKS